MDEKLILGVTGHRPDKLGGYDDNVFRDLVELARAHIANIGPHKVATGMALGWDQAVAQACVELGVPFVAAIPFRGQQSNWPYASQETYHRLLKKAERIVEVAPPGFAPWKMHLRNEWIVDASTMILALWNGTSGGTGSCLQYARAQSRLIRNVWPQYEEIRRTR